MTPTEKAVIDLQEWPNESELLSHGFIRGTDYRVGLGSGALFKGVGKDSFICWPKEFEQARQRLQREGRLNMETEWKDGLPPAGSAVQVCMPNKIWEAEVVGFHDEYVICAMPDNYPSCYDGFRPQDIRPIRSERETTLQELEDRLKQKSILLNNWERSLFDEAYKIGMLRLQEADDDP